MPDYPIPIPKESQVAFWAHQKKSPQNPGLIFDRFMPNWKDHADTLKEKGLQVTQRAADQANDALLAAWNARWDKIVESTNGLSFPMQTDWRLIAGLGKKGSLEVGFTFHRYGFPYLPGSSLKGLARAWGLIEVATQLNDQLKSLCEDINKKEEPKESLGLLTALEVSLSREKEDDFLAEMEECGANPESIELSKRFRVIFGTTEHGGHVLFFDAIPKSKPRLDIDIMNPHYPEYYKEGSQAFPTVWQSPIPVKFLTVTPGTLFRFAVGWRRTPIDDTHADSVQEEWRWFKGVTASARGKTNDLLILAQTWLQDSLSELGAGGKSSSGYGYFVEPGSDRGNQAASSISKPRSLPTGYERGIVKEFGLGSSQSFGFITRSNGADLFVHRNNLSAGLTELTVGQVVIFKIGKGTKGLRAEDVQLEK